MTQFPLYDTHQTTIDPSNRLFHLLDHKNDTDSPNEWTHRRKCLLHAPGYCLIPSVLTSSECCHCIDRIWEFICDTTYGVVRYDDPSTWSMLSPDSSRMSSDVDDSCCNFRSNGAGFLLSNVREILADRVFSLLFGTSDVHSSKEGFLFRPAIPYELSGGYNASENNSTIQSSGMCINSRLNGSRIPYIRAMVAFDDLLVNVSHEFSQNKLETVSLKQGDVLIWCFDNIDTMLLNFIDSPQSQSTAAMFCAMQPAHWTPNAVLPLKMEAYKQRQTGSYCVDLEQWFATRPCSIRTRQFYRRSPPLLTLRQAQLYGLVPYNGKIGSDGTKLSVTDRALVRGVRFLETDTPVLPTSTARAPFSTECKMSEAHLVHLTTTDPTDLMGQDKYLGGMASPCGNFVYGVPGSARQVLRIRVSDGHMDLIGPSYEGKFKWLRGVDVAASLMNNDSRYPDGCCLALPCNAASVLKINPSTDHVYTFGENVLMNCGSDRWHYHGGAVASNGWLYAIPANANRVLKIHPVTDELVFIGPTFHGGQKWFGGIAGSDGCIYGIPHNEQSVLKINPVDDTVSLLVLESGDPLPAGQWKWHGGLRAGDKIFGFPNNADSVLVIECRESKVYTVDGGGQLLRSGRHRIPQDHRYKYLGGATTLDQKYAYLFPCDAERVLRIDCRTNELRLVGPPLLDGENKFQNGFVGRDGILYGIPQRASGVLQIVPSNESNSDDHVDLMDCGPDLIGVKDKFEGGVLGPDGCIYCIPLRSKVCIKIVPGKDAFL